MSAPRGVWLMASAVTGRSCRTDEPYPHVHADRRCGRRGCAACAEPVGSDDLGAVRRGIGGHACEPAGRGTTGRNWSCSGCGADWIAVHAVKAGVKTRTWERA